MPPGQECAMANLQCYLAYELAGDDFLETDRACKVVVDGRTYPARCVRNYTAFTTGGRPLYTHKRALLVIDCQDDQPSTVLRRMKKWGGQLRWMGEDYVEKQDEKSDEDTFGMGSYREPSPLKLASDPKDVFEGTNM